MPAEVCQAGVTVGDRPVTPLPRLVIDTADRPQRPALEAEAAAAQLHKAVGAGWLCGVAVAAVLEAAGHELAPAPPCGLSEREVEVLELLAHGLTNKAVAPARRRAGGRDAPPATGGVVPFNARDRKRHHTSGSTGSSRLLAGRRSSPVGVS